MRAEHTSDTQVRILVVDDEPRAQEDLLTLLREEGYAVAVPRAQGRQLFDKALEVSKVFRPHIVIVDIIEFSGENLAVGGKLIVDG